jgi:hypothetical protein
MSISSQNASQRLFPQSDAGRDEVEIDSQSGLLPTAEITTVAEESRSFAERIWQAVERDVRLSSNAASAGEQS